MEKSLLKTMLLWVVVTLVAISVINSHASEMNQDSSTWQKESIYLKKGIWSEELRFVQDKKEFRLGFCYDELVSLFSDTPAEQEIKKARSKQIVSTILDVSAVAVTVVGGYLYEKKREKDFAKAAIITGFLVSVAGDIFSKQAENHLHKAVWLYNGFIAEKGRVK